MKPKVSLQQKIVYRAGSATKVIQQSLCKVVGENLKTNSEETVSSQLVVPAYVVPSLSDCELITVEYYVKVYLDISFAFDPEVRFPLIIVPASLASFYPSGALGPYPAGAVGGQRYSDFPVPAFPHGPGPYPTPAGPGYTSSGYNDPYGFPSARVPPPSLPPSYTSIYPTPEMDS